MFGRKSEDDPGATGDKSPQRARFKRAAECSPGRKPGVTAAIEELSPGSGDRILGLPFKKNSELCRPLPGLTGILSYTYPGLTPGAILCRHLRWLVEQLTLQRTDSRSTRAFNIFIFSFFLFPFSFSVLPQGNDLDYSKFLHNSQRHASVACSNCHHRSDNSARPSFPGHKDCTGCHLSQFTTPNVPMCSICHVNVNGNNPPLKAFPDKFKESFNVKFDHAQHLTGAARPKNGCSSCHGAPLRRGVALSIPNGIAAHNQCYECHTPNAQSKGKDIASCGVCHDQKAYSRTPTDAAAFRFAFSHAQHSVRQRLGCADCHNYTAGLSQRRQVSSPRAQEHFPAGNNTCATCHSGRRAFGGDLDFKNCRRCHTGQSFRIGG